MLARTPTYCCCSAMNITHSVGVLIVAALPFEHFIFSMLRVWCQQPWHASIVEQLSGTISISMGTFLSRITPLGSGAVPVWLMGGTICHHCQVSAVCSQLSQVLAAPVSLHQSSSGPGRVVYCLWWASHVFEVGSSVLVLAVCSAFWLWGLGSGAVVPSRACFGPF